MCYLCDCEPSNFAKVRFQLYCGLWVWVISCTESPRHVRNPPIAGLLPGSWVFAQARNSRLQAVDTHYPPPSQPASCANFTDVLISFHKSRPQIKMPFVCKLSVEILFACSHTSILYVAMSCPEPSSWGSGFSVPDENSWKLQLFKSFAWKLIFILELMDNFHKLTGFRIFN